MVLIAEHTVNIVKIPIRLGDYAVGIFEGLPSRKSVKKAIKSGAILLNGERVESGRFVKPGDVISWQDLPRKQRRVYPMFIPIVYEDNDLAVLHKPAGIPVNGNSFRNIDNALPYNLKMPDTDQGAVLPVHRLDQATAGLLLIGKNRRSVIKLYEQFANGSVQKTYHALVHGKAGLNGQIHLPIDGKKSCTHFHCVSSLDTVQGDGLSLLRLQPLTGRTHQLRKHLVAIGHPIVGDRLYNDLVKTYQGKGMFLVATKLAFQHPSSGNSLMFELPLPKKYQSFLEYQSRRLTAK